MPKSVFGGDHRHLVDVLAQARKESHLTQTELANRIGKDQTFISLIERSQRRVDVLEFYALAKAMNADPVELFAKVAQRLPDRLSI